MAGDLLAAAREQAERSTPSVCAAALLRIARVQTAFDRELLCLRHWAAGGGKIEGGAQGVRLRRRRGNLDAEVLPVSSGAGRLSHRRVRGPMFVALEPGDFRLKPDSPAREMGIKQIDLKGVGLTRGFPKRLLD